MARVLLERALDAEVPASWVTADEVYGGDPALRGWLEDRGVSYVLAVKGTEPLGTTQESATATQLAASVPVEQWVTCSAGHGAKGCRLYDWVRVELVALSAPGIKPGRKVVLPEPGTTDLATMAKRLLDLEIGEDGSLRLFCGRASDRFGTRFIPDEATEAVFESLVLGSPSAWC